jgi:hypothetical protein
LDGRVHWAAELKTWHIPRISASGQSSSLGSVGAAVPLNQKETAGLVLGTVAHGRVKYPRPKLELKLNP